MSTHETLQVRVSPGGTVVSRFDTPAPQCWHGIADGQITYWTDEDVADWVELVPAHTDEQRIALAADDLGSQYEIISTADGWRVRWYDVPEGAETLGEADTVEEALAVIEADLPDLVEGARQRVRARIAELRATSKEQS